MNNQNRTIPIILATCGILLCFLACAVVVAGAAGFYIFAQSNVTSTPRPTLDPNQTPEPAPTPNDATFAEMGEIQNWVVEQRGLQPVGDPVERKFLSTDEVLARQIKDFEEDTTDQEWEDSALMLELLGLLPPGFDLKNLYLRLYSEGVAGFYDPDTKELVVVSEQGGLNAYEQSTFAHEYNHALQDQNYDLRGMGFSEEGWEEDSEKAAALQALLEGDSTLLDEQYQETLTPAEKREYDNYINSVDVSIYREMPEYLLQDFFFPYSQGLGFVRRYYKEGGWARVDGVWANPPLSTEHIIHPEKYEAGDNPIQVPRPALTDTLGSGWREVERNVMGEWYTYLILAYGDDSSARVSSSRAARAAEGWGGDSYAVYRRDADNQMVLALHWQWDTQDDADEFVTAFTQYADDRFNRMVEYPGAQCWEAAQLHCFFTNGVHTLWLAAPDQATVEQVLTQYPDLQ